MWRSRASSAQGRTRAHGGKSIGARQIPPLLLLRRKTPATLTGSEGFMRMRPSSLSRKDALSGFGRFHVNQSSALESIRLLFAF